ncbi:MULTISPECIES: hypothetical protein [Streptomyces]|jgi:hypothetical protein|uniref:hypothetical protein n=1 Tax=Streptomyces TaxID=1883 RepID=UPI000A38B50B|nr:hypothetical protein [Streptomyces glaucescens]
MDHDDRLPSAVGAEALLALADGHHARTVRPAGTREAAGHLVKAYALEAPGRTVAGPDVEAALRLAEAHLALGGQRGSLGLGVLIVHAGGDGDYVLVHTWIEGHMADLAVFTGPAGRPGLLRPGRAGLAPCVWEAALLAHEREAYSRHVLDGTGPLSGRIAAWSADTVEGTVR